jgi:hypothetical protein
VSTDGIRTADTISRAQPIASQLYRERSFNISYFSDATTSLNKIEPLPIYTLFSTESSPQLQLLEALYIYAVLLDYLKYQMINALLINNAH